MTRQVSSSTDAALAQRVRELEARLVGEERLTALLAGERVKLAAVTAERDKLRRAYDALKAELELIKRRIFVAKAERIDITQLELEFAATKAKLDEMAKNIGLDDTPPDDETSDDANGAAAEAPPASSNKKKHRSSPKGRRDLFAQNMTETRIEILDPALEGKAARIGFEESCRLGYQRGGPVRVVLARATYKVEDSDKPQIVTAEKPKELFERGMLAPSLIARLLVSKYRFGIPFYRFAQILEVEGVRLDDSTMCRYAEDAGATLGCIVDAMAKEARATAFCLSTDATGVCIQPDPLADRQRQACRKGHFFVVLADQDHIFFEYQPTHTSKAVCAMFRGFTGYIQADAHCIYDALFRGEALVDVDSRRPQEVGCWSHARRRFWESAMATKSAIAREALLRIRVLFQSEEQWEHLAPQQRAKQRQLVSRPMLDDFFAWAKTQFASVREKRGLDNAAFGYVLRQEQALRRYLDDGRLRMTNNHSERSLRSIAVGRKNWLFFGSDDHATAAANLFSLMSSCQLHALMPEEYLADIIRVLPHWPRDRYLELAPKYWARTRARLSLDELAREIGRLTVPPPLTTEEQPPTS